jgi:hypothetical protein
MRVTYPLDFILAAPPRIGDGIFEAIHRAAPGGVTSRFSRQLFFIDGSSLELQGFFQISIIDVLTTPGFPGFPSFRQEAAPYIANSGLRRPS